MSGSLPSASHVDDVEQEAPISGKVAIAVPSPVTEALLRDGSRVRVSADDVSVFDDAGHLRLRYVDGHVEICAPTGDVRLSAPAGRVLLEGARGVELRGPRLRLLARRIDVAAETMQQRVGHVAVVAQHWELRASRLLERTREATRETEGLLRVKAGRMRTLAEGLFELVSRRTELTSERDTSIDGERVLLG